MALTTALVTVWLPVRLYSLPAYLIYKRHSCTINGLYKNSHKGASTTTIYSHSYEDGRRLYLIDTPGFDDSVRGDVEVLREQVYLLAQIYRRGLQLSGIVYLHPITKNRVSGSSARNFRMLEALCGPEGLPNVVLLTTMWDQIVPHSTQYREACVREKELIEYESFWGSMCRGGSKVRRFNGDTLSALVVLDLLTTRSNSRTPVRFQIQRELVDEGRELLETSAARQIMDHLDRVLARTRRDLEDRAVLIKPEEMETREKLLSRQKATENAICRLQTGKEAFFNENQAHFSGLLGSVKQDQESSRTMVNSWILQYEKLQADKTADEEIYRRELQGQQLSHKVSGMDSLAMRHFELQYLEEQKRNADKRLALEKAARSKKRKILLKQNIIPILQILGGATAVGVSAPLGAIPVAGAGVAILGSGLAALKVSTKDKRQPQDSQVDLDE